MAKITKEMIEKSFEVGKQVYQNQISLKKAIKILTNIGMKESSAQFHIENYRHLSEGHLFTRTISNNATDYYLKKIHEENFHTGR